MDINEIIKIADSVYPDGAISCQWDEKKRRPRKVPLYGMSDILAKLVTVEIFETYDPGASSGEQLKEAARCIFTASTQCTDVEYALLEAARGLHKPSKPPEAGQHKPTIAEKVQAIVDTIMGEA